MQVFPGDPDVQLPHALSLNEDGVAVTSIRMGSHTGTHLDAPSHTIEGGRTTSDVLLDELIGETLVLHFPGLAAGEDITWEQIVGQAGDTVPPIVLLATGWDKHFGTQAYFDHPASPVRPPKSSGTAGCGSWLSTRSPPITPFSQREALVSLSISSCSDAMASSSKTCVVPLICLQGAGPASFR